MSAADDEIDELTLVVEDPADPGERADVVLGRRLAGISRRVARRLALEGHLLVDGHRAPPSTRVAPGTQLILRIARPEPPTPATVLRLTERFVYVLKPAGMHTHRLRPDDDSTLADGVALLHPECRRASPDPRQGGAVHRLDRDTTGVVAFARTLEAWRHAREGFREQRVLKVYRLQTEPGPWPPEAEGVSPVDHAPPPGPWPDPAGPGVRIDRPLGAAGRHRVAVREGGRPAVTLLWPLPVGEGDLAQFLLQLVTGHRHQARVHLAWLGRPIVGDTAYGGRADGSVRLHAERLDLSAACPEEEPVTAPVPAEWSAPPTDA